MRELIEIEYVYSRSKSVYCDKRGHEELLLFAGLSTIARGKGEPSEIRVLAGISELVEGRVHNVDPDYLTLPEQDLNATISETEYARLTMLYEADKKSFLLYKPTVENSLKLEMNLYVRQPSC